MGKVMMAGRTMKAVERPRDEFKGVLFALIGGSLWGFSGTAVSYLFRNSGIDSTWIMSVRLVISGLLFLGCRRRGVTGGQSSCYGTAGRWPSSPFSLWAAFC